MNAIDTPRALQRPQMRWYQAEAVTAIEKSHQSHRSCLLVAATGLGKTQMFAELAKLYIDRGERVLCLAHRKELVQQAADRIELVTGAQVDIERAEFFASNRSKVVCASLQTICQQRRLERWAPDHFGLVIFDECHHAPSATFQKPLNYFASAKVLGVTATPDRGDEKALGKLFQDVAYVIDLVDGIDQGFLVPIKGRSIQVDEINLSGVGKTAGDLAVGELDEEMVKHIEGIVSKTLELEPGRQGIWFWPGVKSAELACDRINALIPNSCAFVCGETPKEERDELFKAFRQGRFQHLSNCAIATEGVDLPAADMVVMGRPTLSRALYAQCVGRGVRVLPGLVDHLSGKEAAAERKAIIASSGKRECVVVDYCGNAGKHTLMTPEDILGGDYSDEEIKLAKKTAKENVGSDVLAGLEAARRELKAMMAKLQSKVKATVTEFSPFECLRMEPPDPSKEAFREPMTSDQATRLKGFNVKEGQMRNLSKLEASKLLGALSVRRNLGLASLNQMHVLRRHSDPMTNLPFKVASKAMTYLAETCGWAPNAEQKTVLQAMVSRK